jgi:hypothetical protein
MALLETACSLALVPSIDTISSRLNTALIDYPGIPEAVLYSTSAVRMTRGNTVLVSSFCLSSVHVFILLHVHQILVYFT